MFLLVLVMFTGEVTTNLYPTAADCEAALIQKTDVGNLKKIKIAECIDIEKAKEE
jgi:hypothetical protein